MPKSSNGTVRRVRPGPPLVLEVEVSGEGLSRLELPHHAEPSATHALESELQHQAVEFIVEDGQATVFFYRPVTEDGEVESVAKVCLNVELARLSAA